MLRPLPRRSNAPVERAGCWSRLCCLIALCTGLSQARTRKSTPRAEGLSSNGLCGLSLTGYPTCPKRIGVSATGSYGYTESIGPVDGPHHRVAGSIGAGAVALPWLALAVRFDGRLDLHPPDSSGDDLTGTGDPRLFLRGGHAVGHDVSLGGEAVVWFPGNVAPSYTPSATTVDLKALAAWTPSSLPLSLLGHVGYRLDQSANSAPDLRRLRPGDRVALSLSDYDAVLFAFGASTRALTDSELFAEFSLDYLVGDRAPAFSKSPMRGTVGGRVLLEQEGASRVVGHGHHEQPPEPGRRRAADPARAPLPDQRGLSLRLRPVRAAARARGRRRATRRRADRQEAPSPYKVTGTLVDADMAPLPDVRVTLVSPDHPEAEPLEAVTDGEGVYTLRARAGRCSPGWRPPRLASRREQWTLEVAPKMAPDTKRPLTRKGNLGTLRLLTRTFASEPLASAILIRDLHGKKVAAGKADVHGLFEFDLPPGRYVVMISAVGYRPHRGEVQIERHGVAILNVDMREQK